MGLCLIHDLPQRVRRVRLVLDDSAKGVFRDDLQESGCADRIGNLQPAGRELVDDPATAAVASDARSHSAMVVPFAGPFLAE